jgi:hypothetical protein
MNPLALIPLLVLLFAAPLAMGYWLLRPLHLRSRDKRVAVRRFMLIDYVAFAVELQIFLAVAMYVLRDGYASMFNFDLILLGAAALITLAAWWAAVEASARAKIGDWRRRLVFHLFFLPGVVATMVLAGVSIFAIAEQLFGGTSAWSDAYYGGLYTLGTLALTVGGAGVLRLVSAWIGNEALPTES